MAGYVLLNALKCLCVVPFGSDDGTKELAELHEEGADHLVQLSAAADFPSPLSRIGFDGKCPRGSYGFVNTSTGTFDFDNLQISGKCTHCPVGKYQPSEGHAECDGE